MTSDELREIEERTERATPGPWLSMGHTIVAPNGGSITASDIDFVAHAREDVPALVAEIRRLREALAHYDCDAVSGDECPACQDERTHCTARTARLALRDGGA